MNELRKKYILPKFILPNIFVYLKMRQKNQLQYQIKLLFLRRTQCGINEVTAEL